MSMAAMIGQGECPKSYGPGHLWAYVRERVTSEEFWKGAWDREPLAGKHWRHCTNCGAWEEFAAPASPPRKLSHDDLCRLSRAFNQVANLGSSQDFLINEWLKARIAEAGKAK